MPGKGGRQRDESKEKVRSSSRLSGASESYTSPLLKSLAVELEKSHFHNEEQGLEKQVKESTIPYYKYVKKCAFSTI